MIKAAVIEMDCSCGDSWGNLEISRDQERSCGSAGSRAFK